jgi:hypothetical protein
LQRRADGDEAGQVLVLGAQAVEGPGAHRWPFELKDARVHLQESLRVGWHVGVHAAEETKLVGLFGKFGEQLGHPQSRLTVLGELPRRR